MMHQQTSERVTIPGSATVAPLNAREIITSRIAEQARRFPDWLNTPLETADLDARDAALAAAIDHAVMRRWLTLAAVIESRLSRPWVEIEFRMQAALLVGAAQMLLLERLPDHAVINEAVEWAKMNIRPKAGGMVNAVLRKVAALRNEIVAGSEAALHDRDELPLHDGRVWKLHEPVFDEQPMRRLAQQTSHAESLISHWTMMHGPEKTAALANHNLIHAPIIVHGVDAADASAYGFEAHEEPGFLVSTGERNKLHELLQDHPDAIVQDPTSAGAAMATMDLSPAPLLIIDACAGRGTKTRQLARLHPSARIIATDIAPDRLDLLQEQFARHDRVEVIEHDRLWEFSGKADLLALDVPCSNTGVLARRVEAKYRYSRETQESITKLQRQIVADALALLGSDGRLLYSTCSVEAVENREHAEWICKWHPMRIAKERLTMPTGLPGQSPAKYRDGGYHAILEWKGKSG